MFGKKEKIDYKELAKALVEEVGEQALVKEVSFYLNDVNIEGLLVEVTKYQPQGYGPSYEYTEIQPLLRVIATKAASKLADDLYNLRKAEILEEIGTKQIINKLDEKLKEEIKDRMDSIIGRI